MSFLSFVGWPASQGIDVSTQIDWTKRFLQAGAKQAVFAELQISYPEEWNEKVLNVSAADPNWNIVFQNAQYTLWEFLPPAF
jgi:hypothetical protein